jgi:hypothetical protein
MSQVNFFPNSAFVPIGGTGERKRWGAAIPVVKKSTGHSRPYRNRGAKNTHPVVPRVAPLASLATTVHRKESGGGRGLMGAFFSFTNLFRRQGR